MKALTLKYCLLGLAIAAGGTAGGFWLGQQSSSHEQMPAAKSEDRQVLYWYDPMVPTQRFEQPGKSPFMDMELVPKYAGTEQDTSAISVPAQAIQNLGMRTSTVVRAVLPSGIDAVGSLAYNQRALPALSSGSMAVPPEMYCLQERRWLTC